MPPSPNPSITRRVVYSLVMLAIVLCTAEALSRLLGAEVLEQAASPPPQGEEGATNLMGNPFLLYEMAPGDRYEKDIHIAINSYGLRGPEWPQEKPSGTRRIMALGDSSVYGFGVQDEQVFTARLDETLGHGVDVINSAVPGYSTYQTINLLQIRSLSLNPDLALVGCIWSDNNFDSFVDRDLLAAYSSFRNRHARALHELLGRAAIYTILDYKLRVLRTFPEERRVGWMVGRGEKIGERRVPIQEYARNLETIVELAHDNGSEVAFMVLPNREDLTSVYEGGAAWDPYRQVMRDTAQRHGAPVLELPELFRSTGLETDELFLDEMHPTAKGHDLWADEVLKILEDRGWTDGRPIEQNPQPSPVPSYEDLFVEGDHSPPEGGEPPPDPSLTDHSATAQGRIAGTVAIPEVHLGSPIQIDAMAKGTAQPTVLGTQRLEGPGPFELLLTDTALAVVFIAYIDTNGDGPGPGDTRIDLFGGGLELPEDGVLEGVVLDLGAGTSTQTFAEGSAAELTPSPEGTSDHGPIVTDQPGTQQVTP